VSIPKSASSMGAWQDFLAQQNTSSNSGIYTQIPSPLQALKARPLRALVIAGGSILTLSVVFAAFGGPGHDSLHSAYSASKGHASNWIPSWSSSTTYSRDQSYGQLLEPVYTKDPSTGLEYPPDIQPAKLNRYKRAKATYVSLVRNNELGAMRDSMRQIESAFNRKAGYPWVFLNDEDFTEEFKQGVRQMTRSEIYFGKIPREHWSYPDWVDQEKAAKERQRMEDDRVIYGGSESYRHMCRFNSGFFYKHELMQQFDWYWRIEPGVEFFCDIDYDPFLFMERNNKTYSFTIAIFEYRRTIESLWDTVREFVKIHPDYVAPDNALHFMVDDISKGFDGEYNLCHFWSNFEIADLRFWRSKEYSDFFEYLDATGNFFYERWGDAPVHSIAAALFLPASRLHQFDDIAYRHNPYTHCPANRQKFIDNGKCSCNPKDSFDLDGYSCMQHWWRVGKRPEKKRSIGA